MSPRSIAYLATAAFALAAWLWLAASVDEPADRTLTPASARTTEVVAFAAPMPLAPSGGRRESSLAGSDVDGAFTVGSDGRFVADRQSLRLFDYFLSTDGERDADAIAADIRRIARARLSPDEADRALQLYDRYLRYRVALRSAMESGEVAVGDARAALALTRRVQVDIFGAADATRLFGADDALAELLLTRNY